MNVFFEAFVMVPVLASASVSGAFPFFKVFFGVDLQQQRHATTHITRSTTLMRIRLTTERNGLAFCREVFRESQKGLQTKG